MNLKKILFIFFTFFSFNLNSTEIRVVNIKYLIDNNNDLITFISKIDEDQIIHRENFKNTEINLNSDLKKIEELKLILEESELQKEISEYNNNLAQFNEKIVKFNNHYENQVKIFEDKILNQILEILKEISLENNIDLILDSNNYIISSNSINITQIVLKELDKIKFSIDLEKFN